MSNSPSHDFSPNASAKPLSAPMLVSNPYLSSGNFAPITYETTASELRVGGSIPQELNGRYLRNGPSPIGPRDPSMHHWFTGTGLVHGLRLCDGRAEWFRSRFTLSSDAVEALGKAPIDGPGDPRLPVNTSIQVIGGRVSSAVEAGANPIELDYQLNSVARSDFDGTLHGGFTAHPKRDPTTGELVAITYAPDRPALRYVRSSSSVSTSPPTFSIAFN
jgi:carotenoid cleavage dioxygenase-like enzyme